MTHLPVARIAKPKLPKNVHKLIKKKKKTMLRIIFSKNNLNEGEIKKEQVK